MPRLGGALDIVQVSDPTTPQAGRQFLYFKTDGILYTKKPDGAVAQVGSGAAPTNMVTTDTAQTITASKILQASVAGSIPLISKGAASQTGNLQEWQASDGTTILAKVTANGQIFEGTNRVYSAGNPPPAGSSETVVSISVATTLSASTIYLASGTHTDTLPAASPNAKITIKNIGAGIITVAAAGTSLIDGAATAVLTQQWQSISLASNGTDWFVI